MVQIHVSQLRKALPEPRLHTRPPGYLLEVGDDELDLARFRALGRRRPAGARRRATPSRRGELLGDALALWRGPALAEFSEPFARHEGARLEELRIAALEWRIEADLALGHHRDVVGELEALIAEHPLRERLRSQHMLALYRSGRQAEALAGYQAFRRTLADELGIEPSAVAARARAPMLQQDPTLELPAASGLAPPARSRTASRAAGTDRVRHRLRAQRRRPDRLPGRRATAPSTSCSSTAGSAPSSPAGSTRSWPASTGGWRRWGGSILFDKRGTGLSDRVSPERLPDLETRMDDVRAVMDAVGVGAGGAARHLGRRSDVGALRRDASAAEPWRSS